MDTLQIVKLIESSRIPLNNEKEAQRVIAELLTLHGINYRREYPLDNENIIDFYLPDGMIGMEVKIKGSKSLSYRQCERYLRFDKICEMVLVTAKHTPMPKEFIGKPCYMASLSKGWL